MLSRKKANIRYRQKLRRVMTEAIHLKYYPDQKRWHNVFHTALVSDCKKYKTAYSRYYKKTMANKYYLTILWGCASMSYTAREMNPKEQLAFKNSYVKERMQVWQVDENESCEERNGSPDNIRS